MRQRAVPRVPVSKTKQVAAKPKAIRKRKPKLEASVLPEYRIKRLVRQRLKDLGAYQHWPVMQGMGEACLDCHGCYKSKYFAVECKRPGGVPTLRQELTIQKIRDSGGLVFVVDSVEAATTLFAEASDAAQRSRS